MSRRLMGLVCLLTVTCAGLSGCASGLGSGLSKPFRKGEQKEPYIEPEDDEDKSDKLENWQKETAEMRGPKRKPGRDGWLDNLLWSSESQDIARSLNADL